SLSLWLNLLKRKRTRWHSGSPNDETARRSSAGSSGKDPAVPRTDRKVRGAPRSPAFSIFYPLRLREAGAGVKFRRPPDKAAAGRTREACDRQGATPR